MKKIDKKIPIIIILMLIDSILIYFYYKTPSTKTNTSNMSNNFTNKVNSTSTTKKSTISSSSQITSGLEEKLELHNTYYVEEVYVEEDDYVEKGSKLVKYTNGKYLYAPYDLVVTKLNVPSNDDIEVNNNYIEVCSNNILNVEIYVDESKIDNFSIGDSAKVVIKALDNKEVEGIVTDISNSANRGKFTVTIELENTNDIKIGMSANITM